MNNINNFDNSNEFFNEDEIKANKNLFKDVLQQDDINNIYYNELKNNNKENESYSQLKDNFNYQNNNLDINEELVCDNIFNDLSNEYGKELSQNISNIS